MLKKAQQSRYISQAAQAATAHLEAFCRTRGAEELHRFRVDVKRLQALLLLLKGYPGDKKLLNSFQPVLMFYKKAGAIRLLDVHKEMMLGETSLQPSLLLKLARLRDKKATKFISACKSYQLKFEASILKISRQLFDVESRFIIKKFRKQLKKLSVVLSKNKNDIETLHRARKKMKMLLYTYTLLPRSIASTIKFNKAYIKKIESAIGNWHDVVQSTSILATAGYTNMQVLDKLNRQSEMQKHKLKSMTKDASNKIYNR